MLLTLTPPRLEQQVFFGSPIGTPISTEVIENPVNRSIRIAIQALERPGRTSSPITPSSLARHIRLRRTSSRLNPRVDAVEIYLWALKDRLTVLSRYEHSPPANKVTATSSPTHEEKIDSSPVITRFKVISKILQHIWMPITFFALFSLIAAVLPSLLPASIVASWGPVVWIGRSVFALCALATSVFVSAISKKVLAGEEFKLFNIVGLKRKDTLKKVENPVAKDDIFSGVSERDKETVLHRYTPRTLLRMLRNTQTEKIHPWKYLKEYMPKWAVVLVRPRVVLMSLGLIASAFIKFGTLATVLVFIIGGLPALAVAIVIVAHMIGEGFGGFFTSRFKPILEHYIAVQSAEGRRAIVENYLRTIYREEAAGEVATELRERGIKVNPNSQDFKEHLEQKLKEKVQATYGQRIRDEIQGYLAQLATHRNSPSRLIRLIYHIETSRVFSAVAWWWFNRAYTRAQITFIRGRVMLWVIGGVIVGYIVFLFGIPATVNFIQWLTPWLYGLSFTLFGKTIAVSQLLDYLASVHLTTSSAGLAHTTLLTIFFIFVGQFLRHARARLEKKAKEELGITSLILEHILQREKGLNKEQLQDIYRYRLWRAVTGRQLMYRLKAVLVSRDIPMESMTIRGWFAGVLRHLWWGKWQYLSALVITVWDISHLSVVELIIRLGARWYVRLRYGATLEKNEKRIHEITST